MKSLVLLTIVLGLLLSLNEPIYGKSKKVSKKKIQKSEWGFIAGTGIPHPIDFGIGLFTPKGNSHIITAGLFSLPLGSKGRIRNLTGSLNHLEYKFRKEPWKRHPFYWELGIGLQQIGIKGQQIVDLSNEQTSVQVEVDAAINIYSLYAAPHLGFVWFQKSGFFSGFGFGYHIPMVTKAIVNSKFSDDEFINQSVKSTDSYNVIVSDLERLGEKAGKIGLPYLQILQMGYLF